MTDKKNKKKYPETLEAAVELIYIDLKKKHIENLKKLTKKDAILFHFSAGMYIRDITGLWKGNDKLRNDCLGIAGHPKAAIPFIHPDEVSTIIIEKLIEKVNNIQ